MRREIVLDSSNQITCNEHAFNPETFVRELCINTKIKIHEYAELHLMRGWKLIVEDMIETIKTHHLKILEINDYHGALEVKFEMLHPRGEVKVWRALDIAHKESRRICASCGKDKFNRRGGSHLMSLLCADCSKNAALISKTGTWLDKY